MPEVAGETAIQVDPFNSKDTAGAMGRVSADKRLRDDMIQKGFVQKNIFTWDRTASLLYDLHTARYRQGVIDLSQNL